uniref:Uncharacterized protein n=1 Tax=Timema poppense TaxID=170557 RepID=A0A7R9CZD3_TIMPO|nr:unnamed protein product [Timema poppensis]
MVSTDVKLTVVCLDQHCHIICYNFLCHCSTYVVACLVRQERSPGFPCNNDDECVRGAACISPNSTRATGQKLCLCKHEDDDEDDDECSISAHSAGRAKLSKDTGTTSRIVVRRAALHMCAEDSYFDLSCVGSSTAGRKSHFDKCHLIDSMVI